MEGVAEAEAIDTIAQLGFAHPIGPLALADLIGLDTCVAIMDVLHAGSATRSTRRARCCASTSRPGRLGRNQAAGSTSTSAREPSAAPPRVQTVTPSAPSLVERPDRSGS